jgi:hypothetical protein
MTALNLQLDVPPDLLAVLIRPKLTIHELAKKIELKANDLVDRMENTSVPNRVEEQCGLFLENVEMMQQTEVYLWIEHQSTYILEPFAEEMNEYLYSIRWHVAQLDQESWDHWSEAMKQVTTGLKAASRDRLSEELNDIRTESEDDVEKGGLIDKSIRGLVPFSNPQTGETRPTLFTMPWVTKDIENT